MRFSHESVPGEVFAKEAQLLKMAPMGEPSTAIYANTSYMLIEPAGPLLHAFRFAVVGTKRIGAFFFFPPPAHPISNNPIPPPSLFTN
jgi:hypothetical protein